MELILRMFSEEYKLSVAWKQMICAIVLALFLAGLYSYEDGQAEYIKERMKEELALSMEYAGSEGLMQIHPLLENIAKENWNRIYPDIMLVNQEQIEQYGNVRENKGVKEPAVSEISSETAKERKTAKETENTDSKKAEKISKYTEETDISGAEASVSDAVSGTKTELTDKDNGITEETEQSIVLSVELYGNGGTPEVITDSCSISQFSIENYKEPKRMGKLFDGWFCDKECSVPFSSVSSGQESLKLYAGWKEFPGFISNDDGHIVGYSDASKFMKDNLVVFPVYETCVGIEKNALKGLENEIYEIYIPANISYIAPGAFDYLKNLLYIEAASGNPDFYSKNGILYHKNGKVAAYPARLKEEEREN